MSMPYFALTYEVVDDFIHKRMPFRPSHLKEVRDAHARGELVMAGALGDPAGALLVFRAADKSAAENFAKADPYVKEGLVKSLEGPAMDGRGRAGSVGDASGTPVVISASASSRACGPRRS